MKTTIALLISFFMILFGISETATQTPATEIGIYYPLVQIPDNFIQSNYYSQVNDFNLLSVNRDNPVYFGTVPELDMNSIEKEIEANPPIEYWMTNPESWNHKENEEVNDSSKSFVPAIDEINDESDPFIEKWMTEPQAWSEKDNL
jgi:hypothetical protein